MKADSTTLCFVLASTVILAGVSGCQAPQSQEEWGERKGGLNLTTPAAENVQEEREAITKPAEKVRQSNAEWGARKGGLNLAPQAKPAAEKAASETQPTRSEGTSG